MREILFRGKRWENDEWIVGDLMQLQKEAFIHYFKTGCRFSESVDLVTVGQYTGMTDKNGVKIFEGDIVRQAYHPENDYIIEWYDGRYNFRKRIKPKEWGYEALCCVQNAVKHLKIIGNIHDNPELLKGGAE